jgi:hypothetical protein
MTVTINGTTGISSPGGDTSTSLATTNLSYTGTLTGGTGVIAIGTNQIYKDASGNVGIGVTPSAWTLGRAIQISQSASFNGQAGVNAAYMNANAYYGSGGWTYINNDLATSYRQYNGTHGWFSAAAGTGAISAFANPTMTLDAIGNLGIGTGTPVLGKLNVVTGYAATDTTARSIAFFSSSDTPSAGSAPSGLLFQYTGAATATSRKVDIASATYGSGSAGTLTFNLGAATLDSSGNLGLGVVPSTWTAGVGFQVGTALSMFSNTYSYSYIMSNAYFNGTFKFKTTGYQAAMYQQNNGLHAWFNSNNTNGTADATWTATQAMTLDAIGNLLVGTTSVGVWGTRLHQSTDSGTTKWCTGPYAASTNYIISASASYGVYLNGTSAVSWTGISDERFKDILEPISNAVEKVNTLRSVIGKFKDDETNTRRPFLIAQDVQAVLPEAVDASNPDKLGLTMTDTIPLLVAAIKELTTRLEALEAK